MDYKERALQMHRQWKGKIRVEAACSLTDRDDLSTAYTRSEEHTSELQSRI